MEDFSFIFFYLKRDSFFFWSCQMEISTESTSTSRSGNDRFDHEDLPAHGINVGYIEYKREITSTSISEYVQHRCFFYLLNPCRIDFISFKQKMKNIFILTCIWRRNSTFHPKIQHSVLKRIQQMENECLLVVPSVLIGSIKSL